jgi:aconitate hydratase
MPTYGMEMQQAFERGKSYVDFAPDRVAMQDATAQMAFYNSCKLGKRKLLFLQRFTQIT